jgi:hypothetical protein
VVDIFSEKKCQYELQEQKEVLLWYTGIYRHISSTGAYAVLVSAELSDTMIESITSKTNY